MTNTAWHLGWKLGRQGHTVIQIGVFRIEQELGLEAMPELGDFSK